MMTRLPQWLGLAPLFCVLCSAGALADAYQCELVGEPLGLVRSAAILGEALEERSPEMRTLQAQFNQAPNAGILGEQASWQRSIVEMMAGSAQGAHVRLHGLGGVSIAIEVLGFNKELGFLVRGPVRADGQTHIYRLRLDARVERVTAERTLFQDPQNELDHAEITLYERSLDPYDLKQYAGADMSVMTADKDEFRTVADVKPGYSSTSEGSNAHYERGVLKMTRPDKREVTISDQNQHILQIVVNHPETFQIEGSQLLDSGMLVKGVAPGAVCEVVVKAAQERAENPFVTLTGAFQQVLQHDGKDYVVLERLPRNGPLPNYIAFRVDRIRRLSTDNVDADKKPIEHVLYVNQAYAAKFR